MPRQLQIPRRVRIDPRVCCPEMRSTHSGSVRPSAEKAAAPVSPHVVHSGSEDKLVVTYDLKQNKALVQHTSLGGNITNLSQRKDRDNEVVSCAQDGKLLFWDVDYPDPTGCIDSPTGMPLRLPRLQNQTQYV
ncbi:unnamed protein product [Symbiodinium necroappetens]|uniref:Uncharacterized protein n=1 Tax=Symbiodinium necroappetens TaxID=1628268 RepID=A0A812T5X0_9DINO|nr:unnamed protein product [Symbiodinium necroappetens]